MIGQIRKVSGSVITATGLASAKLGDVVYVGEAKLLGEIARLTGDAAWIHLCEDARGLRPGDPVICAGHPMEIELGPGLLGGFYDGIGRSWTTLYAKTGDILTPGVQAPTIDRDKRWAFKPGVTVGTKLVPGDVIGTVQETPGISHKVLVPVGISGTVAEVHSGERTVEETLAIVRAADGADHKLSMLQRWPIRIPRPVQRRHLSDTQIQTGIGAIDTRFPLFHGGTASLVGADGSGRALLEQLSAACTDIDVIVYICPGGRGADMAETFRALSEQRDPKTSEPLIHRTVFVASPDGTPAAMREAAIPTGRTIASYYRDMGLDVLVIADTLAGWVGALSATSGLMGTAAYEGGPPVDLGTRLGQFYAAAGTVTCLGSDRRQGRLSAIGVVPPELPMSESYRIARRLSAAVWEIGDTPPDGADFTEISAVTSYSRYADGQEDDHD